MSKGKIVTFLDEWEEKELFGFSKYEVVLVRKKGSILTLKELKTGIVYPDVKRKEVKQLN